MQTLFHFCLIYFGLNFVICDRAADIECVKTRTKAMAGLTDDQLVNLTQENLVIGRDMALKRALIANNSGYTCYKKFYDNYTQGLATILLFGEQERLAKAKTPQERSNSIKIIAGITQSMRCDEDWKAQKVNVTIGSSRCSDLEVKNYLAGSFNFNAKLKLLESGMFLGKFALECKNSVMSGIVGELSKLYHQLYSKGEACAKRQKTPAGRCRNLKMFVKEMGQLFYLFELSLISKWVDFC